MRALTRRGDECELAQPSRRKRGHSIYARTVHLTPDARHGDAPFVEALLGLVAERRFDVLMPFSTDAVYAIAKHAERFPRAGPGFAVPPIDSFERVHDKARLGALAAKLGVDVPRTVVWEGDGAIARELRYPVVVKARRSIGGGHGVRFANSPAELKRAVTDVEATRSLSVVEEFDRPIVQEFLPGPIHDACALALEGNVVNLMTLCRVVMCPNSGGVMAVGVSTHNRKVEELARAIIEELGWHGPALVEFKHDRQTGRYTLLEVNPRFWGSLDFAIRIGMDFAGMVRDHVLGRPVRPASYRAGIRYRLLLPRAVLAYLELLRTTGVRGAVDRRRYDRTLYDIDLRDWMHELVRVNATLRAVRQGRHRPSTRVPRTYRTTPSEVEWERDAW
jgi:predicted ATP-grasp superfamily ATP-dependent carboligase